VSRSCDLQCQQDWPSPIYAGHSQPLLQTGAEALGAGLTHLFTVQGIARLSTLVSHSPGGSITSLLLGAAMEAALQEAGCGPSSWHPEVKAVL
jgi:hypothetical protein